MEKYKARLKELSELEPCLGYYNRPTKELIELTERVLEVLIDIFPDEITIVPIADRLELEFANLDLDLPMVDIFHDSHIEVIIDDIHYFFSSSLSKDDYFQEFVHFIKQKYGEE